MKLQSDGAPQARGCLQGAALTPCGGEAGRLGASTQGTGDCWQPDTSMAETSRTD